MGQVIKPRGTENTVINDELAVKPTQDSSLLKLQQTLELMSKHLEQLETKLQKN